MKHAKFIGVLGTLIVVAVAILHLGQTNAAIINTNTTLGIRTGAFTFLKDTTNAMNSYFGGNSPNTNSDINIGSYDASLDAISATSSGNHRFTVSDLLGKAFTITLQSSALTASGGLSIAANLIGYTGTNRLGTGRALTATPTSAVDIGTSPVTFVARTNNFGISKYAQEITLRVTIPAAQAPGSYTGLLTFTY